MLDYIVDFYCHELMLAIEVDGDSHNHKVKYDFERQDKLQQVGVIFIRVDDLDVKKKMGYVLDEILFKIEEIETSKRK